MKKRLDHVQILENYRNLHQPLCCMSKGILRFITLISLSYVFLALIIIFLSIVFILYQILRKQNTA